LQRRLTAAGFDAGTADGVIGPQTKAALRAFQRMAGLPEDGHPGPGLLARLRRG
jgi:membrane-bound lytic murein transglycosylase B